ncbi:1-deoxy-D-xylulose-5-phosphate synthase [Lachnospiraceae bacterium XPB1003]|nr:1-deoxy-D-xylulose-5-phosphate synthase [Lachnospiraceae bacterium XPB1003]
MALIDQIRKPNDIKNIDKSDYDALAQEIRDFLIQHISETGGHLASNLGVVELTMALHLSLNLPEDKIIWDVGHQSYTHKLLTGRRDGFDSLRKYGGMSGFPKRKESDCDCFDTGHSSTSISAGLGFVAARELSGQDYTVVSVIGDGSMTGGMAFEGLNNSTNTRMKKNFIIILNDNNMSIAENVGGLSSYLNQIRTSENYLGLKKNVYYKLMGSGKFGTVQAIQRAKSSVKNLFVGNMFFEDMGITYLGPVDGHDINSMVKVIDDAKHVEGAVIIHVLTKKGKGYAPAERHPARFHGAEPFDISTGMPKKVKSKPSYTDVFSTVMCRLGADRKDVVAITAAMPDGTGLKRFHNLYPDRFFDVGIAEQHAVTFAAGLAAGGMHPIVAIYSSFLQRAYDQIIHDVCIQNMPVTFAIDRAGLVGADGETHQGIFDLSFLATVPNMHIMAPKNKWELADMLRYAADFGGPLALRYPRGEAYDGLKEFRAPIEFGKSETIYSESEICLIAVGAMVKTANEVHERLVKEGHHATLINARFVKPIDEGMIDIANKGHKLIVTLEENVLTGGFGERFRELYDEKVPESERVKMVNIALPDAYIEHGNVDLLKKEVGLDMASIFAKIIEELPEN